MLAARAVPYARRSGAALTVVVSLAVAPSALASPPAIADKATAQSELNGLAVAPEGTMTGYSRSLFPHWITISGTCNTRETVLRRDGSGVTVDGACRPVSGSWFSEYDGVTLGAASGVDIDHVVPLAEAWRSGASGWPTTTRQAFANDLSHAQLIAVSASSNRSKSDHDPSTWQPTRTTYRCTYARMWIGSKYAWSLTLQSSEKSALQTMLAGCP
jgi:hypothetical protein